MFWLILWNLVTFCSLSRYFRPMPYTFLPFSAGKRGCTGKHLAKLECKIMIANLIYHYHLECHPDQNFEVATTLSSKPKYKIYVKMTNRRKPRYVLSFLGILKPLISHTWMIFDRAVNQGLCKRFIRFSRVHAPLLSHIPARRVP